MKETHKINIDPTRSEMEILLVLWKYGPSTVRLVNEKLNEQKSGVNYTTTLKLMQIMVEKNILKRDESNVKHIYIPVEEEQKTKSYLLGRFVDAMYNGSASRVMTQLLGNKKPSPEEIREIKNLLDQISDE